MSLLLHSFLVLVILSGMAGCHTSDKSRHEILKDTDCMPDRKSQKVKEDQTGSILLVAEQFVILSTDGNSRYLACNLPDTFKKERIKIKYSLVTKEIFPNERWIATPAYLTKIE